LSLRCDNSIFCIIQLFDLISWNVSLDFKFALNNRTAHIRHQCKKTAVLSCHRCLINTGVEKINMQHLNIDYNFKLPDISKWE